MTNKKLVYKLGPSHTMELSSNWSEFSFVHNCCLGHRAPDYVKELDRWLIRDKYGNGVGFIIIGNDLEIGEIEIINGSLFIGLKPSILARGLNAIISGKVYNQINTFYAHLHQHWLILHLIKKLGLVPVEMADGDEWMGPDAKYYAILGEEDE